VEVAFSPTFLDGLSGSCPQKCQPGAPHLDYAEPSAASTARTHASFARSLLPPSTAEIAHLRALCLPPPCTAVRQPASFQRRAPLPTYQPGALTRQPSPTVTYERPHIAAGPARALRLQISPQNRPNRTRCSCDGPAAAKYPARSRPSRIAALPSAPAASQTPPSRNRKAALLREPPQRARLSASTACLGRGLAQEEATSSPMRSLLPHQASADESVTARYHVGLCAGLRTAKQ
jgi:hypothetical protein